MIITHEWLEEKGCRYSEKRFNGSLQRTNYFPSMYDYENITESNIEIVDNTHVIVSGPRISFRLHQPPNTTTVYYRFLFRTDQAREGNLDTNEGAYLFSFGGLRTMRGRAIRFPADGRWHEEYFPGFADPTSETTTITFNTGTLSSPVYEIKNFEVAYNEDSPYDYFTGDTPDYSTNPPLVYHNGEWQEYTPNVYI